MKLAHIRRYDHWMIVVQRFLEALLFFHPIAWYLSRRLHAERESCCDNLVVAAGEDRLVYAQSLLRVAELRLQGDSRRGHRAPLAVDGHSPSQLRQRIARLLGDAAGPHVRFRSPWTAISLGLACAAAIWTVNAGAWQLLAQIIDDKPQAGEVSSDDDDDDDDSLDLDDSVRREIREVTISGRAVNEQGESLAGAHVFIVPVIPMGVPYDKLDVLAEGKTDAEGRYRFEKVKLSVLEFAPAAVPKPTEALFQVFGIAKGYGYIWRHTSAYRPTRRQAGANATLKPAEESKTESQSDMDETPGADDLQRVFFADEPVVLKLEFSPEVRLHGTIRDDTGNPLKNAVVQVGLVSSNREPAGAQPGSWKGQYIESSPRGVDGDFAGFSALPEEFRQGRTDDDGHYEIRGIPRDCELLAFVDYRSEFEPWSGVVLTGQDARRRGGPRQRVVGYGGEMNHVFAAPVTALVKVLGPARQPLADVVVRYESRNGVRRAGALQRTDAHGMARLELLPGKLLIIAEPTMGQAYLPQRQTIEFKKDSGERSIELVLDAAAEVVFETVEKGTGRPIAGVSFLSEPTAARERQPVQSQVSFVDHPHTDQTGMMRAVVAPGERRFFVNQKRAPVDFEPVAPTTEAISISAEKPTHLRFEFTRRPAAAPVVGQVPPIARELRPLADLLQKQSDRFDRSRQARFHVRETNELPVKNKLTREQMTQLLEMFPSKSIDECLNLLGIRGMAATEIVTDGIRRRVESHDSNQESVSVNVFNGEETIVSMDAGRQLDIFDRDDTIIHFIGSHDFWDLPDRSRLLSLSNERVGGEQPRQTVHHANGAWEIEYVFSIGRMRWVIDDSTGFQRRMSYRDDERKSGSETWQFFPRLLPTGVAVPGLSIRVDYHDGQMTSRDVTVINKVELLDSLPADAFVVAASAGTNIIDYRGIPREEIGMRNPLSGVISADVPDVVAHRNRLAPAVEPVLKVGDQAPELNVLTWLDASGKTEAPVLNGKIIVIDFWGIGCGPCVAGLPEVNAAAKHFANSKIVIIGLHDSGGNQADVADFAQRRGLVFPLAIDQPDRTGRSFGATFSAFGIGSIPACAVIDEQGRVAYLGEFKRAIETANQLAKDK